VLKLGRIIVIIGLVTTAIALVTGFTTMIMGNPEAKFFLMLVPVGFLVLFTGVVMVVMTGESYDQHDLD
jgi:hypothetical protein